MTEVSVQLSILAAASLALAATPASAGVDNDAELWTTVGTSGAISGRLLGSLEAIARFSDDDDGIYEVELGGFIGYQVTDRVALWVGYVRVPRYSRDAATRLEDRTRQQITADLGDLLGGSLSGRLRLEQRFRNSGGTGWRLRPRVKFSRDLAKNGPALVASHESFLPLNDTGWGQRSGYERMRNFVGISAPLAKRVDVEFGYLNQWNFRAGASDNVDHAASLTISHDF